ncbi:helix-turn-helix transcriptional regulator [Vreelandella olivaria]|uniref:helix-turn-helix transcriptional regulator n=1 Tax=Vreelandella olivaria TaxID=390919 RepID=UPI00201F1FD0|nr:helix-turn-helix domain-containing protein [Halomonas olivaria]
MAAKTKPQASAKPGNEFLSAEQAANRYGVHRASIYRWAKEGDFPTPQEQETRKAAGAGGDA